MYKLEKLIRPNIWKLKPYSCARSEFVREGKKKDEHVYLDANESPFNSPKNRYPDPMQKELKEQIARVKKVKPSQVMIGNGSDEVIDLAFRIFCEPRRDNVVAIDPTYGMYQVCADINDVEYRKVLLNPDFSLDGERLLRATDIRTKIIFLCSPNNPTGNLLDRDEIHRIITHWEGIVVLDEAYVDFSNQPSWVKELNQYPNLIILHTFSKAWGLASLRCGLALASEEIIHYFNNVRYPYNINTITQEQILLYLSMGEDLKNAWAKKIVEERDKLIDALKKVDIVERIYPTDANFFLIKVPDAVYVHNELIESGIVVRDRHTVSLCDRCLRITVGTQEENERLIEALQWIKMPSMRAYL
ncbi:MAG: histidinol-phosphate transaminase [Candidatus Azobacteroides sp.]|nr:histidinol-phosphate transaminase [Candidatus Azobacteroides sp.]